MEWYWYWLLFLTGSATGFYFLFFLIPKAFNFILSFRSKKEREELPEMEDDPVKSCPICHKEMSKDSLNGVIVDRCVSHGIWFDKGELETIVAFVKSGGKVEEFFSGLGVEN